MSLASLQKKLNEKWQKLANRPRACFVINKHKDATLVDYNAYKSEMFDKYYVAKAKGNTARHKFPGRDTY